MKSSSAQMRDAFVYTPNPLDATTIEGTFIVATWSPFGSNQNQVEKRILTYWRDFLQDAEG